MEKKKLKLDTIKLSSFITELRKADSQTIIAGEIVDTSKIEKCTPHGSKGTCPSVNVCVTNEYLNCGDFFKTDLNQGCTRMACISGPNPRIIIKTNSNN